MFQRKRQLGLLLSAGALALAFLLPLAPQARSLLSHPVWPLVAGAGVLFVLAAWMADDKTPAIGIGGVFLTAATSLALLHDPDIAGSARSGFWIIVTAAWLASVVCVVDLAAQRPIRAGRRRFLNLLVPLLFGAVVFYLWEVAVRGFGVPPVLLPAPSAAAARFAVSLPTLGADFVQTFVRGVLIGYAIGCGAGLVVAILAHRFAFLGRGLLPLGNFFSALPLVGIAPIMVMWFGFDWPSKAAVVALVTFFPMLVNALAGLSASGHIERDLMRSYARELSADPRQAISAGGAAVHLQRAEDQCDTGADWRNRCRVFRHADAGHRISHLHRGGPHGDRHGLGGDRARSTRRNGFLRICRAGRTRDNFLAPVVSDLDRQGLRILEFPMKHTLALAAGLTFGLALSSAQAADPVTIQLKWVSQAQFAGYFVARDKGFYKEAGLDVTIKPGGPDVAPPQVIAGGGADVVVDWMPSALASREKGVPLVNISQTFKKSGLELTCRAETGIKKPVDLKGRTLGVWYGGNEYPFLSWMSKLGYKTDGSPGAVKVIKQGFNVDPLLQKQADCVSTMTYNEYWQVIDGGYKPSQLVVFKYEDEGVATLEDGLWVLEKNLKDPAFVAKMAKFVKASMKGWDYAKAHPDDAVKIILAADTTGAKTEKDQKRMMGEIGKLLGDADGKLDVKDYERTVATLMAGGSDPVITKKPEGAYSFAVYDAMKK